MKSKDEWSGEYYKEHSQPQHKSALKIIDAIKFNGNESILDIGCGDGKITAELARRVPNGSVIGIDASPDMIKQAICDFSDIKNVSFICQDATEIDYDDQFDYVLSFAAIHWVENKASLFKKIYKALKSHGKLLITAGTDTDSELKKAFATISSQPQWGEHFSKQEQRYKGIPIPAYKTLLSECGFEQYTVIEKFHQIAIPSKNALVKLMMSWMPNVTGLSEEPALQFTHEIAENIYKQKNAPFDLPIEYGSPFAYIEAQKLKITPQ